MAEKKKSYLGHRTLTERSPAGNIHKLVINPSTPKKQIADFYAMVEADTDEEAIEAPKKEAPAKKEKKEAPAKK